MHFVINMTFNSWKCYNVTRISNKSLDVRTKAVSWLGFGALTAAARVRFPAWELYHVLENLNLSVEGDQPFTQALQTCDLS